VTLYDDRPGSPRQVGGMRQDNCKVTRAKDEEQKAAEHEDSQVFRAPPSNSVLCYLHSVLPTLQFSWMRGRQKAEIKVRRRPLDFLPSAFGLPHFDQESSVRARRKARARSRPRLAATDQRAIETGSGTWAAGTIGTGVGATVIGGVSTLAGGGGGGV